MRAATTKTTSHDSAPMTLGDLRRALDDKERDLRELLDRKDALAVELEEIGVTLEAMLAGSGVAPGRRTAPAAKIARAAKGSVGNGRGKPARVAREGSLPVVIRGVLERVLGPMRVAEIAEAVVKAGYATTSKNLNIIVANRLSQMKDIEKVERGLYQLKRAAAAAAGDSPSAS
jgi:hypothetical protein